MFFPADLLLLAISVNTGHYVHGINACIPPYILFVNCAYLCSTPMRTFAVCPFISITDNVQNNLVTLQRHDFLVISNSNFNWGQLDSVVLGPCLIAEPKEQTHVYMQSIHHNGLAWYHKHFHLSRDKTKPTKWLCAQRRLRSAWASAQSDQSPQSAWRKLGSLATHWTHSKDWSDRADA